MGFRRLTFLLSVTYALSFAACGDNKKPVFEDAMTDTGDVVDDAPIDTPDAPPDCGAAPNKLCNGTCVNTNTDNANCGDCGDACGTGQTCTAGICCATGQTNCNGVCVDTTADEANCGGCAPPNGTGDVCDVGNGETCMNSTCCGGSNTACGNQCFDLQTDPNHCGTCTTVCGANQDCSMGHCCADGFIWCNNACVDPNSDEANCGGCAGAGGSVCSGNDDVCDNGKCCAGDPILNCGETTCTDTDTDEEHCGACGNSCGTNETCTAGKCCAAGLISCNGLTCINPNTDMNNCGGCTAGGGGGEMCDSNFETCDGGDCCGPGQQNCGSGCVDVLDDFDNCGACGDPCNVGEVCSGGACVATCGAGETQCPGGDCVDLTADHGNCGTCGNDCASNEVCNNGTCTTTGCAPGETNCSGSCVNLGTDPNHCGTCPNNCATGDVCSSGICCDAGLVNTGGICCVAGSINCNGQCVDPTADTTCGSCVNNCTTAGGSCEPDSRTNNGTAPVRCCPANQVNCDGTCADTQVEENNCGACGVACAGTCDDGICCLGATEQHCTGNTCQDIMTDEAHCGGCGLACDSGETCSDGICCPADTVSTPDASGTGPNICCALNETNCGGTCRDLQNGTPPSGGTTVVTHCGTCNLSCGTNQFCAGGLCGNTCLAPNNTSCGICTNPQTDENACGAGCEICAAGATCNAGDCQCPAANPSECTITGGGTVCIDTGGVPTGTAGGNAAHCGGCGLACTAGQTCDDLVLTIAASPGGATGSGATATFVTTRPHGLAVGNLVYVQGVADTDYNTTTNPWTVLTVPNTTTFTVTIPGATGGTLSNSGGGTVRTGECCGPGLQACPGTVGNAPVCANFQTDPNNCGSCGNVCGNGQSCTNGACACPFGTTQCGAACIVTSNDPDNCGACSNACGPGAPFCVSNGCVASCPAPLSACGDICTNRNSDSNNCGTCGNVCPSGQGCVSGTCRPKLALLPDPAKCVGGGPPIVVPDGSGGSDCTGNLGAVSFTFALCSRTNMGPLSQDVFTDAFNSLQGPHRATCTIGSTECGTGIPCVGDLTNNPTSVGTCVGGGVGLNGIVAPVLGGSKKFEVGGDFWVMGSIGLERNGDTTVKQRTFIRDSLDFGGGTHRMFGQAFINGPIDIGGSGSLRIDQTLYTADTPCDANTSPDPDVALFGTPKCSQAVWDNYCIGGTNDTKPCSTGAQCPGGACVAAATSPSDTAVARRDPCGGTNDLIKVKEIVEYFRDPARNDNKTIGLRYDALANPSQDTRVELNCGYYYLDSLGGSNEVTIVVKGRAALFIGGAANINVEMIFDVAPTATLDIFIGSVVRIAHPITLGSPAFPRLTRMWIGSATGGGGGTSCTQNGQCTSGLCSACNNNPDPNAVYTATCSTTPGTCQGGGNLTQAIDMSQGGFFNGLLWAGYGSVSTSNAVEMYGSIFMNYLDASGALKVHYDRGAVVNGECPPPPSGGSCESCRDCGNQACVNNTCGACTSDSQCCPPLRCGPGGSCIL